MSPTVRTVKVAIIFGLIFLEFLSLARSLQCFTCFGDSQEPIDEPSCSNQIQNCTGAENTCATRLYKNKSSGKTATFKLQCEAQVDCERGNTGCHNTGKQTICTYCCQSDLCNTPEETTVTPTTDSGSRQLQPLTNMLLLVSCCVLLERSFVCMQQ